MLVNTLAMGREDELTPQSRAAKVTWLLAQGHELTTAEIMAATGLTGMGVYYLMKNLDLADIPLFQPATGRYQVLVKPDGTLVEEGHRLRIVQR